jgi:3-oxoacyl-[acyl-carrier protein] reductase
MALGYADEGADLVLSGRRLYKVEETAEMVRQKGRRALALQCDVTDERQVNAMVDRAIAEFGKLDVVVNNAGQGPSRYTDPMPKLWELDDEEWNRIWNVNLTGPFLCMKAALPKMQPGSSLINVISISGRNMGMGGGGPYPMSKYTLEMMTKLVAAEQKERGVRVNGLCPGIVAESEFWDIAGTRPAWSKFAVGPEVIVPAAVFLACDESQDVTGQAYFGKWFNDQVAATGEAPRQGI